MWTLDEELCKLAGERELEAALKVFGIVVVAGRECVLRTVADWNATGSNYYDLVFEVATGSEVQLFRIVAATPAPLTGSPTETVNRWVSRRVQFTRAGGCASKLFAYEQGTILEEFVPKSIDQCWPTNPEDCPNFFIRIAANLRALNSIGCQHLAPITAMRSRGTDAVVVDFGSDLGETNTETSESHERAKFALIELIEARYGNFPRSLLSRVIWELDSHSS